MKDKLPPSSEEKGSQLLFGRIKTELMTAAECRKMGTTVFSMPAGMRKKRVPAAVCPVLLHIPHSSQIIPEAVRPGIFLSDADLSAELLRMTDHYTDELFAVDDGLANRLVYPVSRLVADPERFREDEAEVMAGKGMGAVYTSASNGVGLRDGSDREALLTEFYDPHHRQFEAWVSEALATHGRAVIIDCHSYPSTPLPSDLNQQQPRPDTCIGTDSFHTSPELLSACSGALEAQGWTFGVDWPYAGCIVPTSYYRSDSRVQSIMIELNRSLYMDEKSGAKLAEFESVGKSVRAALSEIIAAVAR
jgi:N-formylglutamate deformylase